MSDRRDTGLLRRFYTADWQRLVLNLTEYAICKTRRLYWKRRDYQVLARGETAESLVSWAVEKVLSGERQWNTEKYPDLEVFLKGVIDSLIHTLVISLENRKLERLPENPQQLEALLRRHPGPASRPSPGDPESALLEQEEGQREAALLKKLVESIQGESELVELFDCLQQGMTKPQVIAQHTGFPIQEVYQLIRKLKRRFDGIEDEPLDRPRQKAKEANRE